MKPKKRIAPTPETYVEGKLPVTKIDVAVRQLETAITLWFNDGDPVSICTLAYAAHEILFALNNLSGNRRRSIFDAESVRPEYKEQYKAMMRSDPVFCKHGAKDPHATHFLTVRNLPIVILDAAGMYNGLGFGRRAIIDTFQQWLWLSQPDLFVNKPSDVLDASVNLSSIIASGKKAFFQHAVSAHVRRLAGLS